MRSGAMQSVLTQVASAFRAGGELEWKLSSCLDAVRAAGVAELLRACADDPETLREIARGSYVHPNGFEKITLGRLPELGVVIRLHVWPQSGTVLRSDVHDHRWSFGAVLLTGQIERVMYEPVGVEHGARLRAPVVGRYRYSRGSNADSMRLVHEADVALLETARYRHAPGTFYVQRHDQVHRIDKPAGGRAISLFVSDRYEAAACSVFKSAAHGPESRPASQPIEGVSLRARLLRIADEIEPVDRGVRALRVPTALPMRASA